MFYLTKVISNVLFYRLLNLDFDLILDILLSINTFISGCFLIYIPAIEMVGREREQMEERNIESFFF